MPTVPAFIARLAVLTAAFLVPAGNLAAATHTWLNIDGTWGNAANWQGGIPMSAPTTDLEFGGGGLIGYTSTNDLPAPFQVNTLNFTSTASAIQTIDGSQIEFPSSAPTILQSGTGAVSIKNDILLTKSLLLDTPTTGGPFGAISLDGVISGGVDGTIGLATTYLVLQRGTWRITNAGNSYTGGTTVRGSAVLELMNSVPSPFGLVLDRTATSLLGKATPPPEGQPDLANRLTLNAGVVRLLTQGSEGIVIGTGRPIYFNNQGGTVEILNSNPDDPAAGGGHILSGEFALTLTNALAPAVFKFNGGQFGLSELGVPPTGSWEAGKNALRFSAFSGFTSGPMSGVYGALRVELTNGAMVRAGTSSAGAGAETVYPAFTARGVAGGDPTSGLNGTVNTGVTLNTGRVVLEGSAEVTYSASFTFQGALQVAPVTRSRALNGNLIVAGTGSGFPGYVSFSGRGATTDLNEVVNTPGMDTTGQNVLWLLRNGSASSTPGDNVSGQILTIEDGGIAVFDPHVRSDMNAINGNGVALDGLAVLKPGAELRVSQSVSKFTPGIGLFVRDTGDIIIYGDIRGEGTTAKESVLNLFLPEPQAGALVESTIPYTFTSAIASNRPYGGLRFDDSRGLADLIVNGSDFGGLKITASPRPAALLDSAVALSDPVTALAKVAPVVNATRLSRLTGSGGYLTVATPGQTWPFPAGGEWAAAVPVGLKITDHNTQGADVSFSDISAFVHSIALDGGTLQIGGSPLLFGPASPANGLGKLQGKGTVSGPISLAGGADISPGLGSGAIGLIGTGDLSFMNGSKFTLDIQGLTPGVGFDQLQVTGSVTLEGSLPLVLTLGFNPVDFTDSFIIIQNDGLDAVIKNGVFHYGAVPLLEGTLFDVPYPGGTQTMRLTYIGGDGNDVELRATPEPGSALLAVAGLAGLLGRRNRRAR